jgi:hypothetical protein
MPYSIKTKDGIVISDIPDDVPADSADLKSQVSALRAAKQKAATFEQSAAIEAPVPAKEGTTPLGLMGGVVRGAGPVAAGAALGAALGAPIGGVGAIPGAIAGAGAAGLTMLVGDPVVSTINNLFGTKYTMPSEALEDLFTRIGVAQPKTEAERIVQAAATGAAGAGSSVALGKAIQAGAGLGTSISKGVGQVLAASPVQQVAGGVGAGIAQQGAAEAGASPIVQAGAGMAGGIAGSALSGIRPGAIPTGPIKEAEQTGIRLMTSDIRQPGTFAGRWLRALGEKIPMAGTGATRSAQQSERVAAVRDIVTQYGAEDLGAASENVMRDLLTKRSADLSKWSKSKTEVIDRLSFPTAGQPQISGAAKLLPGSEGAVPSKMVPMPNTLSKINDSIQFLDQLKTEQVKPIIAILKDWGEAIQGQDLRNIETLRKQIGEVFKAPEMASVRSTGDKVLSGIYGSVKDDMGNYIKTAGGASDLNKWKVADKELSKMMGELELSALETAIKKGEMTPEAIKNILFSKNKSDVAALYRNLSSDGRAAARSAILAKAAEKAGGEELSPDKFTNSVKAMGDQIGVFFSGDDLKQVQGLARVLNTTKRASQAAVMPATGVQVAIPATITALNTIFGGGINGFILSMAAGAGIGGAARLYESKAVRNILMKIPTVKVGSPEEAALFKRLLSVAQTETEGAK